MKTFEIADENGNLGVVRMTPSNIERFCANFDHFLERGILLTGFTVPVTVIDDDAVVNGLQLLNGRRAVSWYVESTDDPANFDVNFTVTTNDGQTLNYTVHYVVGARDD
jgi:uncharacterized iron-regulated membrane protein